MSDKYCPLRFREYDSNPHDQRCIGDYCAWFDKCSQSHGESIYGMPYGNMEPRQAIATETPQEPRETAQDSNDVDSREKLEADMVNILHSAYMYAWMHGHDDRRGGSFSHIHREFFNLLDRQAAITERHWMEIVGASANANVELKRQIDELQEQVNGLIAECSECVYKQEFDNLDELERAMNEAAGKWAKADALADELREEAKELRAENTALIEENGDLQVRLDEANDQVYELTAERDRWKACYEQRNEEANEYAEKLEELERENAKLSSEELHLHAEADFWKRKYELICKALIDLNRNYVHVEDEGLA